MRMHRACACQCCRSVVDAVSLVPFVHSIFGWWIFPLLWLLLSLQHKPCSSTLYNSEEQKQRFRLLFYFIVIQVVVCYTHIIIRSIGEWSYSFPFFFCFFRLKPNRDEWLNVLISSCRHSLFVLSSDFTSPYNLQYYSVYWMLLSLFLSLSMPFGWYLFSILPSSSSSPFLFALLRSAAFFLRKPNIKHWNKQQRAYAPDCSMLLSTYSIYYTMTAAPVPPPAATVAPVRFCIFFFIRFFSSRGVEEYNEHLLHISIWCVGIGFLFSPSSPHRRCRIALALVFFSIVYLGYAFILFHFFFFLSSLVSVTKRKEKEMNDYNDDNKKCVLSELRQRQRLLLLLTVVYVVTDCYYYYWNAVVFDRLNTKNETIVPIPSIIPLLLLL